MPFSPNSALYSRDYPRNIKYIPVVIFFVCLDFEKTAILGQPPCKPDYRFLGKKGSRTKDLLSKIDSILFV